MKQQRAAEFAWDQEHREPPDMTQFQREILPGLNDVSARAMSRLSGLSTGYCGEIKRGERAPHPRWWETL